MHVKQTDCLQGSFDSSPPLDALANTGLSVNTGIHEELFRVR